MAIQVHYRAFREQPVNWEALFEKSAKFASTIAPERLISISHSSNGTEGIVSVWFWDDEAPHGIEVSEADIAKIKEQGIKQLRDSGGEAGIPARLR